MASSGTLWLQVLGGSGQMSQGWRSQAEIRLGAAELLLGDLISFDPVTRTKGFMRQAGARMRTPWPAGENPGLLTHPHHGRRSHSPTVPTCLETWFNAPMPGVYQEGQKPLNDTGRGPGKAWVEVPRLLGLLTWEPCILNTDHSVRSPEMF